MVNPIYVSLGVNPAGTTLVVKTVRPDRKDGGPFAPEFFLSEWERKPLGEAQELTGEMILRLLSVHYPAAFAPYPDLLPPVVEPTEAEQRAEEKAQKVVPLAPFDFKGNMRPARMGVGLDSGGKALRVAQYADAMTVGHEQPLLSLDRLGKFEARVAWQAVGEMVLRLLAMQHPDVFAHFSRVAGGAAASILT